MADDIDLVRKATLAQLADALAEDVFGRYDDDAGRHWFRCPKCRRGADGTGGGSAVVTSETRWHCTSCRHHGTRWALERLVLDDAILIDRLTFTVEVPRG